YTTIFRSRRRSCPHNRSARKHDARHLDPIKESITHPTTPTNTQFEPGTTTWTIRKSPPRHTLDECDLITPWLVHTFTTTWKEFQHRLTHHNHPDPPPDPEPPPFCPQAPPAALPAQRVRPVVPSRGHSNHT